MRRLSDEEILGLYAPRGLSGPLAEGEQIACARLHCSRVERTPGVRAHKWMARLGNRPPIELCPRCHSELATIISGG